MDPETPLLETPPQQAIVDIDTSTPTCPTTVGMPEIIQRRQIAFRGVSVEEIIMADESDVFTLIWVMDTFERMHLNGVPNPLAHTTYLSRDKSSEDTARRAVQTAFASQWNLPQPPTNPNQEIAT